MCARVRARVCLDVCVCVCVHACECVGGQCLGVVASGWLVVRAAVRGAIVASSLVLRRMLSILGGDLACGAARMDGKINNCLSGSGASARSSR